MCEADKHQFFNKTFIAEVESSYGALTVIVNACGLKGKHFTSPAQRAVMVALSPYWVDGRDNQLRSAAAQCELAWADDDIIGAHCNNCFHRGILAFIVIVTVAFGCNPQDRMSIF